MALLVRDKSIWMTPPRRANVPEISSPLAFIAANHTWNRCPHPNVDKIYSQDTTAAV